MTFGELSEGDCFQWKNLKCVRVPTYNNGFNTVVLSSQDKHTFSGDIIRFIDEAEVTPLAIAFTPSELAEQRFEAWFEEKFKSVTNQSIYMVTREIAREAWLAAEKQAR